MSGGSFNYFYSKMLDEVGESMHDAEMNAMINDLSKVLHDLEWWQSDDISENDYRKSVRKFKNKWFKNGTVVRRGVCRNFNICKFAESEDKE